MLQVKRRERGLVSLESWMGVGVLGPVEGENRESLFSSPAEPSVPFSSFSAVVSMGLLASS